MKEVIFLETGLHNLFIDQPFEVALKIEGATFRKYENRVTKRFEAEQKSYFIKTHGPVGWKEIIKNLVQFKIPVVGAKREFEALEHLSQNSISCPSIKGYGFKGINPANSSSFLITEELYNTISLEDFFSKGLYENLSFKNKRNLIIEAANLIRRMHSTGLNHRDLYLCHVHIQKDTRFDAIQLSLIDLHRAQIRSRVPSRWLIKDLGGFIHSVLQFNLTERDFYRFFMAYFGCSFEELIRLHQTTLRKILQRAFKMYLKPQIKEISLTKKTTNKESIFIKFNQKSRRFLIRKDKERIKEKVLQFFEDEEYLRNSGEVIKDEEGHLVVKVEVDNSELFIKKYRIKNFLHGVTRLFKSTRAYNSMKATLFFNAAGIKTANPVLFCEDEGFLGAKTSYLVTESITGKRLDEAIVGREDSQKIVANFEAFFKRISWIDYCHGDAKTSNFFIHESLVAFDLDSSRKSLTRFGFKKNLKRDRKRILKSLKGYNEVYLALSKRFHRS